MRTKSRVAVVGGGLAGLVAATACARRGHATTLIERSRRLGGRAASEREGGFALNQGAHALFPASAARLRAVGVEVRGRVVPSSGVWVERAGEVFAAPGGVGSMVRAKWLSLGEKASIARTLGLLGAVDVAALEEISANAWLDRRGDGSARAFVAMLVRVATYAADLDALSAAAAVEQLRRALVGVRYLDGGWQSLVDSLTDRAREAGVTIASGAGARRIESLGETRRIHFGDDRAIDVDALVLAVGPSQACALLPDDHALRAVCDRFTPVRAACLDLALSRLPNRDRRVVFPLEAPLYLSVHSEVANVAADGGAVVHAMKYLREGDDDPSMNRAEIEALLDRHQAGWRDVVVRAQWLPRMIVTHALPTHARGPDRGRARIDGAGDPRVLLSGDWVGDRHQLADAAIESAIACADAVDRIAGKRSIAA